MIILVPLVAVGLGLGLIVLIARYAPHAGAGAAPDSSPAGAAIPYDDFRALCVDLLEVLGFHVVQVTGTPDAVDIVARSTRALHAGRYLVHAVWAAPGDVVPGAAVMHLAEALRADGAARGILLTPWRIGREGLGHPEHDIELVDGAHLRRLIEEHLPTYPPSRLSAWRGFGAGPV